MGVSERQALWLCQSGRGGHKIKDDILYDFVILWKVVIMACLADPLVKMPGEYARGD